jgi:hypothetical protein
MLYNVAIIWIYLHVEKITTYIINKKNTQIDSLKPNNIHNIYKLLKPKVYLKKHFLDVFRDEKPSLVELIKEL